MEDRMTAQQLKNSILQMAVQGKLVPQDPNDEPASVLLDRIRKEKEQLIKDGKIKKNKKESYIFRGADNLHYEQIGKEVKCIEDELPFEIPGSWCWSRFSSLYSLTSGQDLSPNNYNSDKKGIAYITGASNITDGKIEINRWTINPKSTAHFGDLLFTCKGTVGKMAFLNVEKAHIARQIMSISSPYDLDLYYLKLILRTNLNSIKIKAKSMIPGISRVDVLNILIPLPPIDEQNRIVEKIKEIEPLIEKYKQSEERLYELNSNIKEQLKKSILQYAIEGKLVSQNPNDEPASVLLERIHKEKEKLIVEGKIKKDKNESIIYSRDNSYYEKFDKCERCINDQIPFEIPNSWCWERLSSFCIINMGSSPKGNSINSDEKGGYEFHQGKSFFSCKHLLKSNVYTNQPTKLCPSSSVLLSVRAPVGKVNIVDRTICIGRGLASIKPFIDFEIELLYYFLTTLEPYFIDHSTGSTFKAITSNIVKECLLPVPPKNEQNRLLVAIKKIFSLLN